VKNDLSARFSTHIIFRILFSIEEYIWVSAISPALSKLEEAHGEMNDFLRCQTTFSHLC
jgi:hypothetical protein